ncbi:YaeF family permuted papain-like enzyme [Klebsiella huaxiensis]|uniref:YaeF family permuted papain-like enzyme n=1 Tax=Klebsiella huaxiensis TaxID=2153354 RepID=A0ABT6EAE0_9ENTR|nr:YaeF family permuted papain-like enzyme [Klebsiella huaxiensis]MDG1641539.1 YaeF family permuted papain-like enzyme [Klebsiella huaxiensis]
MANRAASYGLLFLIPVLLCACTMDLSQSAPSESTINKQSKQWAIKLQRQGSITDKALLEISEKDLRPGDLLFSSSIGVTSLGIRAFSTSSVSHVAIYLGDSQVAEATGAGVQIVSLKQAMQHSDKLFALRAPDLTPQQAAEIKNFAYKNKDSGYNYRGIIEFIPFMMTKQMCSLNPFSRDFRQQCVNGLAKAQLSDIAPEDKKTWFCSEFVSDAFAKAGHPLTMAQPGWISPSDLLHMREGGVSTFKPETQLLYAGHLKLGVYIKTSRLVGLN